MSRSALAGLRVAVTRTPEQASALMEALEREGAHVAAFPLIRIEPVMPREQLADLLQQRWDWVVFTSANAVRLCAAALAPQHATPGDVLPPARIAVIGPATAEAARTHGLSIDAMPETFIGDAMAGAIADAKGSTAGLRGLRVFWPRAEASREVVLETLRRTGATVEAPVVYRSVPDRDSAQELAHRILQQDVDVVTFTSPSCVRSLAMALPELSGVKVATIGPVTAEAARDAGYPVDIVAAEYTADGIVAALREAAGRDPRRGPL
ncbi:MAG: uroporphyrinogen-III synthase [Longimicrobiales bacterium]